MLGVSEPLLWAEGLRREEEEWGLGSAGGGGGDHRLPWSGAEAGTGGRLSGTALTAALRDLQALRIEGGGALRSLL